MAKIIFGKKMAGPGRPPTKAGLKKYRFINLGQVMKDCPNFFLEGVKITDTYNLSGKLFPETDNLSGKLFPEEFLRGKMAADIM